MTPHGNPRDPEREKVVIERGRRFMIFMVGIVLLAMLLSCCGATYMVFSGAAP